MNVLHGLAKASFAAAATALCMALAGAANAASPDVGARPQAAATAPGLLLLAQRSQQRQPPAQETTAPAGAGGAGRYALLREEGKDTGCLVNLLQSGRAQLGPGCKDQGLVVFDPTGWTASRGAIVLRARKGHRVNFVYKPDGTWLREPADKRPLALRKH